MTTTKLIEKLAFEDYLQCNGLSISHLKRFAISPAHCRVEQKQTKAMLEGAGYHALILEPDTFNPTGIGKAGLETIQGMVQAFKAHPVAPGILKGALHEVSAFWHDSHHGLDCKARFDAFIKVHPSTGLPLVIDFKKSVSASFYGFSKAIANYKYHWQAFWYIQAACAVTGSHDAYFVWVAQEPSPPFAIGLYMASPEMLMQAQNEIDEVLPRFLECRSKKHWPGYPESVQTIQLPRWAQN